MSSGDPFTFSISLIPRDAAGDWNLIEALLDLTLSSVRAQTDPDFRVVIAGHDRPEADFDDPRIDFLQADWDIQPPGPHNTDAARKQEVIRERVQNHGGGLVMQLDADDWVDVRLVETARSVIRPDDVGGVIETGFMADLQSLRVAPLPAPGVSRLEFHRLCGSSIVARLRPDAGDPARRDPWSSLYSHHIWVDLARERGLDVTEIPVSGSYLVNTSENHSELHGPHASGWRRSLTERVGPEGEPMDDALARRFGLRLDRVRAVSERFFPRESA